MDNSSHENWMRLALEEAEKALIADELPIGGVLVANNSLLGRTQTQVVRRGSTAAHGELLALLEANGKLYTAQRPLILYTTLEPCLMCFGAMMNCEIDEVVIGMRCAPDGGIFLAESIQSAGQKIPKITIGVLEKECVEVMRKWNKGQSHPAYSYLQAILKPYSK
jgi:tRNA(adenine34) deaminase